MPSTIRLHTGKSHSFGGEYVELTPHERIRYTDRFDDPNLPGQMHVTVVLKMSFRPRLATSAGRSRSSSWRNWSRRRSRNENT